MTTLTQPVKQLTEFQHGVLDLVRKGSTSHGLPKSESSLTAQAQIIVELAKEKLAIAFSVWSHRMTLEYLTRFGSSETTRAWAESLSTGKSLGSTALATALVDASGRSPLPIEFRIDGEEFIVNGFIPWASNLSSDTVVVFAARGTNGERFVFSTQLSNSGISFKVNDTLLEMNETQSGSISLNDVKLSKENLLSESLKQFLSLMRPRFLTLQSAFCLGVAKASYEELSANSNKDLFAKEVADSHQKLLELDNRLIDLASKLSNQGEIVSPIPYLQLRLDTSQLAQLVARLELAVVGGKAFHQSSDTARRLHESMFFVVQAPTEGALKWELSQSN
jgi:alkylation response protein AidB-like acyl-CoA dehydrogenase